MFSVNELSLALDCNLGRAATWHEPLKAAMSLYDISTPKRIACFLAQMTVETAAFSKLEESLNYDAAGLIRTFNNSKITRFSPMAAQMHGRAVGKPANQRMIANIAYGNRMGNGGPDTGDGWNYRGRSPTHLTGKFNYEKASKGLNVDLVSDPDLALAPDVGCLIAAWFWVIGNGSVNLNTFADVLDIDAISDVVNIGSRTKKFGDANGFAARQERTTHMMKVFT